MFPAEFVNTTFNEYEKGDMIGCGVIFDEKKIFFTKNGTYLGVGFKDIHISKNGIYPSVSLQSKTHQI